jgi:biotin carboxyl carrier protein
MKLHIEFDGKMRAVELTSASGGSGNLRRCVIDGREVMADAAEINPGVFSILIGGQAFEARVEPFAGKLRVHVGGKEYVAAVHDPRQWKRGDGAAAVSQGRQQVIAPMPGKIVRVLVKPGEEVEAGQGLVVVEAMKMQNAVRSPKSGTVERVLVAEGQAVNAGEVVAIIA